MKRSLETENKASPVSSKKIKTVSTSTKTSLSSLLEQVTGSKSHDSSGEPANKTTEKTSSITNITQNENSAVNTESDLHEVKASITVDDIKENRKISKSLNMHFEISPNINSLSILI